MSKASPFIIDRAIPLYPGLAIFLDYLPGVDDRDARNKSVSSSYRERKHVAKLARVVRDGAELEIPGDQVTRSDIVLVNVGDVLKIVKVGLTQRGINRALVLTQLDHRLADNPGDHRLLIDKQAGAWYARSYPEWHDWDFPFMPEATMKKAFQDLADAGFIKTRAETDFMADGEPLVDRRALLRAMRIYNGKAFSIDYRKLEAAMAADKRVQDYFERYFPGRTAQHSPLETSDQADPTQDQPDPTTGSGRSDPPDQPDPTTGSGRSDPPDQPDPTPRIRLIRDQQSLDQNQLQLSSRPSAAAEPDPAPGASDLTKNGQAPAPAPELALDNNQRIVYMRLLAYQVDPDKAVGIILSRRPEQIDAWLDYIKRANAPGSNMTAIKNPGGYFVKMLEHPENFPRPKAERQESSGERFLTGPLAGEIKH